MCSVIKRWVPLWICFWYEILVYGSGMSFWYEFVSGKSFWYNFVSDMSFCYEFVSGMKFICVVLWVCSLIILYLMNWHYNFIVMIFFPPISCHSISLLYFWKTYATYQAAYFMVLTWDGNSEHFAHASRKNGLFGENIRFVIDLDLINCL